MGNQNSEPKKHPGPLTSRSPESPPGDWPLTIGKNRFSFPISVIRISDLATPTLQQQEMCMVWQTARSQLHVAELIFGPGRMDKSQTGDLRFPAPAIYCVCHDKNAGDRRTHFGRARGRAAANDGRGTVFPLRPAVCRVGPRPGRPQFLLPGLPGSP